MKSVYSIAEASAILGVGLDTVYEAIRRNELPSIGVGRRAVIPKSALDRLVKDGQPEWAKTAWERSTPEQARRRPRRSHERKA